MNIITPPLNQNRRNRGSQRCKFCASIGFLAFLTFLISPTVVAEDTKPPATNAVETQTTENTVQKADTAQNTDITSEMPKEKITGTADKMERYDKDGITILIGNAKTTRYNEQDVEIGFLNADKITLKADPETGTTTEIVAEGNVEIRDQDIFATCDHAIMNNLTNIITLKENVVVLQDKDCLETKLFTFNRTTGKQTGEGGVKFKVTVTQAAPVTPETDENTENGTDTGAEETPAAVPEKADAETQEKADAETSDAEGTAEEKSETDAGTAEDTDSEEETETDTENAEDADANAETEESENN
ncbi:LPS export ABC transporter periplasmic protein LptC [Candidatus Poribacteria bacterium]|nr:LPS export ABC transporter periplasmic protein LptC [Candidatus Poribacteria bacterium]